MPTTELKIKLDRFVRDADNIFGPKSHSHNLELVHNPNATNPTTDFNGINVIVTTKYLNTDWAEQQGDIIYALAHEAVHVLDMQAKADINAVTYLEEGLCEYFAYQKLVSELKDENKQNETSEDHWAEKHINNTKWSTNHGKRFYYAYKLIEKSKDSNCNFLNEIKNLREKGKTFSEITAEELININCLTVELANLLTSKFNVFYPENTLNLPKDDDVEEKVTTHFQI